MKAAERLCVTPSAVSHALRDFEQSLGTKLFERTSEGVQPTTAGQRLYAKVKPLVVGIEAAERELRSETAPEQTDFAFASIHTNHGYAGRETIQLSPTEALTTDQLHSAFQVPFGALASFDLAYTPHLRPYVAGKIGAMYEQNTTYLNTVGFYERPWGLYVSPEIGLNIYPQRYGRFGFHVAVYYSYATNDTRLLNYQEDGKNSVGFRLGICF